MVPRPKSKTSKASDEVLMTPRLIAEFAVENMAKAKQQAVHRAQQEANQKKQKQQSVSNKKKERKKSRGASQRERKRKDREDGHDEETSKTVVNRRDVSATPARAPEPGTGMCPGESTSERVHAIVSSSKPVKQTKKRKVDPDESKFSDLVETYKRSFAAVEGSIGGGDSRTTKRNVEKRWFE
jgi:hypothetical protein